MDKGTGDVGHRIAIDQQQVGTCSRCDTPSVGESEALLTIWEGKEKRALDHLREAAALAEEIGLPAEQWQIRVLLGNLYEAEGEYAQARPLERPWRSLVRELAEGIKDEALRARFLAGPQIYQVLQHAHGVTLDLEQFIECYRQIANTFTSGVEYRVGNCGSDTRNPDFANPMGSNQPVARGRRMFHPDQLCLCERDRRCELQRPAKLLLQAASRPSPGVATPGAAALLPSPRLRECSPFVLSHQPPVRGEDLSRHIQMKPGS
jgi:hypothetical protein